MGCYSFLPIIIILIIIFNIQYNENNEQINLFLTVILILCIIFKFINSKCKNKEHLENEETKEQKQKTQEDKNKYYSAEIEDINSLFNNDRVYIDYLTVGSLENNYIKNLIYPIGSVILSDKKLKDLNLPGEWKKIEGGRLMATTGNITITRTLGSSDVEYPLNKAMTEKYTDKKYNIDVKTLNMKHNQTSKDANNGYEIAEETVKLYGNNIMNHEHPIWMNWQETARDKGGAQKSFAIMGGKGTDKNKCKDESGDGSKCVYELYPTRKTLIYKDNKKVEVSDSTVKPHNNIPKYVLVFAYIRIK